MNYIRNINFKFLQDFDLFGKEPNLFYKGKEKKTTYFGSIISLLFFIIYLAFLIYKLNRMLNKTDVTFYDTFEYLENPPSIKLFSDIFYVGFALEHPITYDPFIDEGIYYPRAFFKNAQRNGDKWIIESKEIELERCKIEKFGKDFQDKLIHNSLDNLYCFKEMNETLQGHFSYNSYSYLFIQFFPCINSTDNNNNCKSIEEIDFYLNNSFIGFEMEDIQLTPNNYSYPIRGRNQDIYFTVGKKLYQEVHIFLQLVNIETDLDILGFDEIKTIKKQQFLQFHSQYQMTNLLENNIYDTGESFSSVTIKLYDEIRTQSRTYTKIIEVLSDVGGFMEFIFLFLRIISSFSINTLYELSIVNNLFEFDLDNKLILVRNKNQNIDIKLNKDDNIYISNKSEFKLLNNSDNNKNLNEIKLKFNIDNHNLNHSKTLRIPIIYKNRNEKEKSSILSINEATNKNLIVNNVLKKIEHNKNYKSNNDLRGKKNDKKEEKKANNIIREIKINRICLFLCFCYVKKQQNRQIFLLNEGMKIFIEKMDILRIFKKVLKNEKKPNENKIIKMSDTCKNNLLTVNKIIKL